MSINNLNRNRGQAITDNHTYRVMVVLDSDPYFDEGYTCHYSKGWKTHRNRKTVSHVQYRMFRTWKHNRRHQWK